MKKLICLFISIFLFFSLWACKEDNNPFDFTYTLSQNEYYTGDRMLLYVELINPPKESTSGYFGVYIQEKIDDKSLGEIKHIPPAPGSGDGSLVYEITWTDDIDPGIYRITLEFYGVKKTHEISVAAERTNGIQAK